jgi:hypothetical protein
MDKVNINKLSEIALAARALQQSLASIYGDFCKVEGAVFHGPQQSRASTLGASVEAEEEVPIEAIEPVFEAWTRCNYHADALRTFLTEVVKRAESIGKKQKKNPSPFG